MQNSSASSHHPLPLFLRRLEDTNVIVLHQRDVMLWLVVPSAQFTGGQPIVKVPTGIRLNTSLVVLYLAPHPPGGGALMLLTG